MNDRDLNSKSRVAIFINCHSKYGGAERRFFRSYINSGAKNLFLITNRATFTNLHKLNKEGLGAPNNLIIIPGGVIHNGYLYKAWHILNAIMLVLFVLINKISHVHYPVDPSLYSWIHSWILSPLGITFSLSVVDSSRTAKEDFSLIRFAIWKRSLERANKIDFLSTGIQLNVRAIFPSASPQWDTSPCSFTDYSKAKFNNEKKYDLVMFSRFVPKKGHAYLIEALKNLSVSLKHNLRVGLFGDGPTLSSVKASCVDIEGVEFSFASIDDVFPILSESRVLLSLQADENYPSQAILEAYACGVLCIVTDVGESYKLVKEGVGFLVPSRNPRELARTIEEVLCYSKCSDSKDVYSKTRAFVLEAHSMERYVRYLNCFLGLTS